jgi:hypothetical protein
MICSSRLFWLQIRWKVLRANIGLKSGDELNGVLFQLLCQTTHTDCHVGNPTSGALLSLLLSLPMQQMKHLFKN